MDFGEALQQYERARNRQQIVKQVRSFLAQFLAVEGEPPDNTMWLPTEHGTDGTVSQESIRAYIEELNSDIESQAETMAALRAAPIDQEDGNDPE